MPKLTGDEVRHIGKLARLSLSDQEVDRFTTELTSILNYIDQLKEVDTKKVEPTPQVTGLQTVLRPDSVTAQIATPDDLLKTSPLPIVQHQIQTPSAHG